MINMGLEYVAEICTAVCRHCCERNNMLYWCQLKYVNCRVNIPIDEGGLR